MQRVSEIHPAWSGFAVGLVLIAAYALLRTLTVPEPAVLTWTAVAVLATLASPLCGLTVLAALGPFTEALTDNGRVTAVPFLLAALGASVVLHTALTRWLPRPSVPVAAAAVLFAGTALGVLVSAVNYGTAFGIQALQLWVPGIGGAMTVLLAAAWLSSRTAELRPLFVAIAAVSIGALLSFLNAATNDAVRHSAVGWLLRTDIDLARLGGLLPAPNAAAALFVVGIIAALAVALDESRPTIRALASAAAAVQAVALLLTYSRAGLLALGLGLLLLAWRRWPRFGAAIAVTVVLVMVAGLAFLWVARDIPLVSDQNRLLAWAATARMWLANPLLGSGFRSFEWLHADYGSPYLDAPHNEWLRLFGEEGTVIGLAGLVFAMGLPLILLRSRNRLAAGTGAAAAGLFLAACFNNPFLNTQLNVPAFLIIGTGLGLAVSSAAALRDDH
ncbi:MAG: O-antigen ligase family protein, partial [Chloroflexota bacterium]